MQQLYFAMNQAITHKWLPFFLAASALTIPISSTAKSICLVLSVLFIVFNPSFHQDLRKTLSQPWCKAALLLFAMAAIACLWSPATMHERTLVLEKYSKLLYLPVLAVGFRDSNSRHYAIRGFIVAMAITCILSFVKALGYLSYNDISPDMIDPGTVFRNHIMTGYMMAFAAFLAGLLAYQSKGRSRLLYSVLFFAFSIQVLLINTGRTGYVIYLLLMGILAIHLFSWRQALMAALLGCVMIAGIVIQHEGVQTRLKEVAQEWNQYHHTSHKDTSIGYRLQFQAYANTLFLQHPIIGAGTGSFTYSFGRDKPVPSWDRRLLEPHNIYWLVAVEFGVVGLVLLGAFFSSLIWAALHLNTTRPIAFAVIIPFLVGNLTDSLLFYSGTGFLFILFMALCLGEQFQTPSLKR
jgi:O-antigen ligase